LAEKSFRKSVLIVPNRLYPYYLLMKMIVEIGDKEKALVNAQIVLTKEPKVQSTAIKEMRQEARRMMNEETTNEAGAEAACGLCPARRSSFTK